MSIKPSTLKTVDDLIERYPALEDCKADLRLWRPSVKATGAAQWRLVKQIQHISH
jgi:hypothetical protein